MVVPDELGDRRAVSVVEITRDRRGWLLRYEDGGGTWLGDDGAVEHRPRRRGGWAALDLARRLTP